MRSPPDLKFRSLLATLGEQGFFERNSGRINQTLVQLWGIAYLQGEKEGLSYEEMRALFAEGYDGFPLTATPWGVLLAESISGVSDARSSGADWMLRTAGGAFAAYGVRPRFKH